MPWHHASRSIFQFKPRLFSTLKIRGNPDNSAKIPGRGVTKLFWLCFIWTLKRHSVDSAGSISRHAPCPADQMMRTTSGSMGSGLLIHTISANNWPKKDELSSFPSLILQIMTDGYQSSDEDVQEYEPTSSDGKSGQVASGEIGRWNGILSKLLTTIRSHVPLGYEDETGFHTGIVSPEK